MKQLEGLIISIKDYRDADVLMQLLCEDGIYSIVGKGIRKLKSKNAPSCQLFAHVLMNCNEKNEYTTIFTLRSVTMIDSYRKIRENLIKQSVACLFCEGACALKDEMLYEILLDALSNLEQTNNPYCAAALFVSMLIRLQGIEPNVDGCVRCGDQRQISGISFRDGGFVCANCLTYQDLTLDVLRLKKFRLLAKADFSNYSLLESHADWDFTDLSLQISHLHHYGAFRFYSYAFLEKIASL